MSDVASTLEDRGSVLKALTVTVPADEVSRAFDETYKRIGRKAQLRGFRKGKVPRKVLEEVYGESAREDVVHDLIRHACAEAVRQQELDVVSDPELLSHDLKESGELVFEALVEVRPQFELGTYAGLEIDRKVVRITESHVDSAIESLRERMAALQTEEDRVNVAQGDIVVFDMSASSRGEPIESASGEGVQLEVGSGRFPEDFEKQLVGVTRSITTPIEVQFPEDQGEPELAGKLVRFDVTVREIKNKILPDLDDAFAAEVYDDCETVEQLRARVRSTLEERAAHDADHRLRGELIEMLVGRHDFDVPPSIVERQMSATLQDMGITEVPRERVEEIRNALEPGAIKRVRASFVLDAVARAEQLEVAKEELEEEVRRQLVAAGKDADQVRKYYSNASAVAALRGRMLRDKAVERVVELATRRDVEVDESEVAASSGTR
jgi:trigger factor